MSLGFPARPLFSKQFEGAAHGYTQDGRSLLHRSALVTDETPDITSGRLGGCAHWNGIAQRVQTDQHIVAHEA
jgi:hypothetical protein